MLPTSGPVLIAPFPPPPPPDLPLLLRRRNTHINALPREVLSLIFVLSSRPVPPFRPPDFAHIPAPHFPTTLAHVCALWRSVAFQTPRLWTDIRILAPPLPPQDPDTDKLAFLLPVHRSAPHLYSLSIRALAPSLHFLPSLVPPHLPRCASLRLTGQIDTYPPFSLSFLPGPLPHLARLHLEHVELPSMRVLVDVLEQLPALAHLALLDIRLESDLPGAVRARRKLRALRFLALQVDENFDIIQGLFPRVVTPSLTYLSLAYGAEGTHVSGPFIIYDDCMSAVSSLCMRGEVLATDFALSMMQKCAPLRTLTLDGCGVTDEFLDVLGRRQADPQGAATGVPSGGPVLPSAGGWIAPRLERVRMRACDYVSGEAVGRFVRNRLGAASVSEPGGAGSEGFPAFGAVEPRFAGFPGFVRAPAMQGPVLGKEELEGEVARLREVRCMDCEGVQEFGQWGVVLSDGGPSSTEGMGAVGMRMGWGQGGETEEEGW